MFHFIKWYPVALKWNKFDNIGGHFFHSHIMIDTCSVKMNGAVINKYLP